MMADNDDNGANNANGNENNEEGAVAIAAEAELAVEPGDIRVGNNPLMIGVSVEPSGIRSKSSNRHSYVRFINQTVRRVDVIWINYEGVRVKYKTLEPAEYFDVTSFVSHPWVFLDSETHTKLVTSSKEIFDCPPPRFVRLREGLIRPTRAHVTITLPVYSLHECALQTVQRNLRSPKDAYQLEVPPALQKELFQRCSLSWTNRNSS